MWIITSTGGWKTDIFPKTPKSSGFNLKGTSLFSWKTAEKDGNLWVPVNIFIYGMYSELDSTKLTVRMSTLQLVQSRGQKWSNIEY